MSHNRITSIADKQHHRRELNANATKAAIIKAARAAFVAQSYAEVKLDAIARSAHATTGAIYHHFGGKAELLLAVGESVEQEVVVAISARIPSNAAPWEAIRAAAAATIELCSQPEVANIIFKEAPSVLGAAAWRAVEMRYGLGGLHVLFSRAAAQGELRPNEPALVARLVMAALVAAVEEVLEAPDSHRAGAVQETVRRMLDAFCTKK
jgi:AcrR family transcriptional regulator